MQWWDMQVLGLAFIILGRVEDSRASQIIGLFWMVFSFAAIARDMTA